MFSSFSTEITLVDWNLLGTRGRLNSSTSVRVPSHAVCLTRLSSSGQKNESPVCNPKVQTKSAGFQQRGAKSSFVDLEIKATVCLAVFRLCFYSLQYGCSGLSIFVFFGCWFWKDVSVKSRPELVCLWTKNNLVSEPWEEEKWGSMTLSHLHTCES